MMPGQFHMIFYMSEFGTSKRVKNGGKNIFEFLTKKFGKSHIDVLCSTYNKSKSKKSNPSGFVCDNVKLKTLKRAEVFCDGLWKTNQERHGAKHEGTASAK